MEPSWPLAFAFGAAGSLIVELLVLKNETDRPRWRVPARYRSGWYWGPRVLLALLSGLVAAAYYNPATPLFLYIHIGAATPAIMSRLPRVGDGESSDDATGDG